MSKPNYSYVVSLEMKKSIVAQDLNYRYELKDKTPVGIKKLINEIIELIRSLFGENAMFSITEYRNTTVNRQWFSHPDVVLDVDAGWSIDKNNYVYDPITFEEVEDE